MIDPKIIFAGLLLLLIVFGFTKIRSNFYQLLFSNVAISKAIDSQCQVLAISSETIDQFIAQNSPKMNIAINNQQLNQILIDDPSTPSYLVFALAVDTFTKGDSMLRMTIDRKRLKSIKQNNYIDIKFQCPVKLNLAKGSSLTVSNIVIPLSEAETMPEWNFYYSHDSSSWFALRWMQPDSQMLRQLRQNAISIIEKKINYGSIKETKADKSRDSKLGKKVNNL